MVINGFIIGEAEIQSAPKSSCLNDVIDSFHTVQPTNYKLDKSFMKNVSIANLLKGL